MGNTIKVISDHAETLGDGRERAPGELAEDVDLTDATNARLIKEGRILDMGSTAPAPAPAEVADRQPPTSGPTRRAESGGS